MKQWEFRRRATVKGLSAKELCLGHEPGMVIDSRQRITAVKFTQLPR